MNLQMFSSFSIISDIFFKAEVETTHEKANTSTRNIFDQLDALDDFLDQTTGETDKVEGSLIVRHIN
jgi:hypothetical protein